MMRKLLWVLGYVLVTGTCAAAPFATPGAPEPANIGAVADALRQDAYDLELLISYGTSKGGSAGHLALAVRGETPADDVVYSANFYADRSPEHAAGFYTDDLVVAVPKMEYLYGTTSSLGERASFGLDFGEVYKRSVVGVRIYGVPAAEKRALVAFFHRVNDDYRNRRADTDYHDGEIVYGYLDLNCAKTIGMAFKRGAGYQTLEVNAAPILSARKIKAAVRANVPTAMAMKLMREWDARGYGMDVVLYRKYMASTFVDTHDDEKVQFKDLPNRFPSVLSRDFRNDAGEYVDADNLYAMYLLYDMGRYVVTLSAESKQLAIEALETPMAYPAAAERATKDARTDSRRFQRRSPSRPSGRTLGSTTFPTFPFDVLAAPAPALAVVASPVLALLVPAQTPTVAHAPTPPAAASAMR